MSREALAHHPDMEFDPREKSRLRPQWFDSIGHDTAADYIIKGLLSEGGFSMVYGPSGSGKSFLVTDMALAVARAASKAVGQWFGRRVRGCGVIVVAAEGQAGFGKRICANRKAHPTEGDSGTPFALLTVPINLLHGQDSNELVKLILERCPNGEPVRLVVVDTLARTLSGGDENDPQDMGRYIANVGAIQAATGAHVCLVHHTGKDAGRGARGHSSLLAAVDTAIEVTRDAGGRTATVVKQKDGADGEVLTFALDVVDLGLDDDGDPITSCVVRQTDALTGRSPRALLKPQHRQAMALLHECILDLGAAAPESPHVPRGAKGVTKAQWRAYLSKGGLINEDGNPREQMRRLLVTLKDQSAIGVWEDFIWPVTPVTTPSP